MAVIWCFPAMKMNLRLWLSCKEMVFVASRVLKISDLAAGGFKDTKGNDIKNADEWRMVYGPINQLKLVVSSSVGTHSYSQWLQEEMIKHGDR